MLLQYNRTGTRADLRCRKYSTVLVCQFHPRTQLCWCSTPARARSSQHPAVLGLLQYNRTDTQRPSSHHHAAASAGLCCHCASPSTQQPAALQGICCAVAVRRAEPHPAPILVGATTVRQPKHEATNTHLCCCLCSTTAQAPAQICVVASQSTQQPAPNMCWL